VNVTVENLAPCKKLVRFEIAAPEVDAAFEAMIAEFQKGASLPGFRPGKAPRDRVLKQYEKEIADEVKRKLISESYRKAVKEQKLSVLGIPDLEEIQFERGKPMLFATTLETAPDFPLPEYRGLPARREMRGVTEQDIGEALDALRTQRAQFEKVDRAVQEGDFVVVNYTGACEGKPITEIAPGARGLSSHKNFWVEVKADSFIPGFALQLVGARAGEKRTVSVDFPANFVTPQLAGRKGSYDVEVIEVKERKLPPLDNAFAQSYDAESLEKLREGVRQDLQNDRNYKQKHSIRAQIIQELLRRVSFDLPETLLQQETRNVVFEIVQDTQKRGVPKDLIEKQKDEIYALASHNAKEKLKLDFIYQRIAEKEGIRALPEEVNMRIVTLAHAYQMAPQKFLKELEKRDGVAQIYQQLVQEKVLDFLHENAKIEDAPAEPASPPPA
jgi:trigger factor